MKPSPVFSFIKRSGIEIDWKDKTVLDFGGNVGRLLTSSNGEILPENYTCIDVNSESLDLGKHRHPDATWIKSNEYNHTWNPDGKGNLIIKDTYDIITCLYVFVHMDELEIKKYIDYLYTRLNNGGKMICTFPSIERGLLTATNLEEHMDELLPQVENLNVAYVSGNVAKPSPDGHYDVCFINSAYFIKTFLSKYTHKFIEFPNSFDRFVITKE